MPNTPMPKPENQTSKASNTWVSPPQVQIEYVEEVVC
jgi:hypothetical protein